MFFLLIKGQADTIDTTLRRDLPLLGEIKSKYIRSPKLEK